MASEDAQTLTLRLLEARLRRAELAPSPSGPDPAAAGLAELERLLELRLSQLAGSQALSASAVHRT